MRQSDYVSIQETFESYVNVTSGLELQTYYGTRLGSNVQ
jgi:hypothetical protein